MIIIICIVSFLSTLSLRRATYGRINDISRLIFLSTLSLRRATKDTAARQQIANISIHALLAESDREHLNNGFYFEYFYPRSPCGERLTNLYLDTCRHDFYPRSPCGERRAGTTLTLQANNISIHALLAESDVGIPNANTDKKISIHALLAESDQATC